MNLKLEIEFSKADILTEVDALKKQIDDMRPLPPDVEGRVMQKLRLDWNYHSNAIEGNQLSYGETVAFLMEGITAKGKPLKDHLDIRGHNEAINFLLSIVKEDSRLLSESDIRALHKMVLVEAYDVPAQTADGSLTKKRITPGEYKTSPNHVQTATGEIHYYATPEETPAKMQELMEWYAAATSNQDIHPIVLASLFHHKFVAIHPFDDGNGRLSRILMNLVLMQKGYPPVVVKMEERKNYYALLNRADRGDSWPFVEFISGQLLYSLNLFLRAATGEDIDEDDDIDKEIALFKMELSSNTNLKIEKSKEVFENILKSEIEPLMNKIWVKAKKFDDLFFDKSFTIEFDVNDFSNNVHQSLMEFFAQGPVYKNNTLNKTRFVFLKVTFLKFKNIENDFGVSNWVKISFGEYKYSFYNSEDKLILSKLYHENLTYVDQQKILKALIEDLKNNISEELKGPEST